MFVCAFVTEPDVWLAHTVGYDWSKACVLTSEEEPYFSQPVPSTVERQLFLRPFFKTKRVYCNSMSDWSLQLWVEAESSGGSLLSDLLGQDLKGPVMLQTSHREPLQHCKGSE